MTRQGGVGAAGEWEHLVRDQTRSWTHHTMAIAVGPERPSMQRSDDRRLKLLLSAYACEPGKGSEPGVGWHTALEAARHHEVWVITRANNRAVIEESLARHPMPTLHPVYYDLPGWARWWKRGRRGTGLYYYLWQLAVYPTARRLHREVCFDVCHHVTFATYWKPSVLALLPVPLLWGPVGGGESAPASFQRDCGPRGRLYEKLRTVARALSERDPFVVNTARRSAMALAVTEETARRIRGLGARKVGVLSQLGLSAPERVRLQELDAPQEGEPLRFLSVGNLLHLKGFHLGLRAFAAADLAEAEYWLVGEGPFRRHLELLAHRLGIERRCGSRAPCREIAPSRCCDTLRSSSFPAFTIPAGWRA